MIRLLVSVLVWSLHAVLRPRTALVLENLALRQQLATYARGHKRPQVRPEERLFWVVLSKTWSGWRSTLLIVKPATVIAWGLSHPNDSVDFRDPAEMGCLT